MHAYFVQNYVSSFENCVSPDQLTSDESKEECKDQESIQSSTTPEWESDKNTRKHHKESQEASPLPIGNHKAQRLETDITVWQRQTQITKKIHKKKRRPGTVSKKTTGGLKLVSWSPFILMWIKTHRCLVCMKIPKLSMNHILVHINQDIKRR